MGKEFPTVGVWIQHQSGLGLGYCLSRSHFTLFKSAWESTEICLRQRKNLVTGVFEEANGEKSEALFWLQPTVFHSNLFYKQNYEAQFEEVYLKPPLHRAASQELEDED